MFNLVSRIKKWVSNHNDKYEVPNDVKTAYISQIFDTSYHLALNCDGLICKGFVSEICYLKTDNSDITAYCEYFDYSNVPSYEYISPKLDYWKGYTMVYWQRNRHNFDQTPIFGHVKGGRAHNSTLECVIKYVVNDFDEHTQYMIRWIIHDTCTLDLQYVVEQLNTWNGFLIRVFYSDPTNPESICFRSIRKINDCFVISNMPHTSISEFQSNVKILSIGLIMSANLGG